MNDVPTSSAPELILATRNPHKLREFSGLLEGFSVQPLPEDIELPPETGETFAENALVKARTAAAATGRPAIADDSGISARALGGEPGVYSARYAGPRASDRANLNKLIAELSDKDDKHVEYVCAVAYVAPPGSGQGTDPGAGSSLPAPSGSGQGTDPGLGSSLPAPSGSGHGTGAGLGSSLPAPSGSGQGVGGERVFEGRCGGVLIDERRGSGGFGYDPCVVPDDYDDGRTMAELSQAEKDAISHRGRAVRALAAWLAEQ